MGEKYKVFSFDIFDTLILRRVKQPCDIFGVVYERNKKYLEPYFSCGGWIKFRKEIETIARAKKAEANIRDIYYEGKGHIPSVSYMLEQEFMCECDACILNEEIVAEIVKAKQQGYKVVLISDMYWPLGYMKRLLSSCGLAIELDGIYISCDYGESKSSGKLYDIVTEQLKVLPSEIFHTGDNISSDYTSALNKGINANIYTLCSFSDIYFPFLEMEKKHHDRMSILPVRLMTGMKGYEQDQYWHTIGAMIYAPLIVGALEFVIDTAVNENIGRIYPFMREGDFFVEILNMLICTKNCTLEVKELYVSRNALKRALEDDQIGSEAIKYFERMGLNEDFITFDIGYAGTTGTLLDNLLKRYGISARAVHCLGIEWSSAIQNIMNGHDFRGYIHAEDDQEWKDIRAWILELSFMSEKGRTESYGTDGSPRVRVIPYDEKQIMDARKCQEGIRDFARKYCEIKKYRPDMKIAPSESHEILSRFFRNPLLKDVNAVGDMVYDENYYASFNWKVIEEEQVAKFKEKGFLSFEYTDGRREAEWVAGINTLCNPSASLEGISYYRMEYEKVECIKNLEKYISNLDKEKFFLVGFGFWGREIMKYLTAINKMDCLAGIIDNNATLRGVNICKKRIISMEDSLDLRYDHYLLSVQKKEARVSLEKQIYKLNKKCQICSIWG
nr:HAD family hydrolase [uncultured Acetatifactor sp.]